MSAGRVYNFSAGPAVLPVSVLEKAASEMLNYNGSGMGIMEMSHRTPVWEGVMKKTEDDIRKLLDVPANYKILFHEGGATHQFSGIPLNLMGEKKKADYIVTGTWSKKAAAEAKRYGEVNIIGGQTPFNKLPDLKEAKFSPDASYVYYCDNETIEGVEFREPPTLPYPEVPLVADMSSNFMSKKLDISKFGVIYSCAQKNYAPAGLTVMIIREDLLEIPPHPLTPTIMMNKTQAANGSMYNTPATYNIYIAGLTFEWILGLGGLAKLEEINRKKAMMLYDYIDGSNYYRNPVQKEHRSFMNVTFLGPEKLDTKDFQAEAKKVGLVSLGGHRSVGGFRASIYNAMPVEGVEKLIEFMKKYAAEHPF